MSFITVGLDENKTYNRVVPPGGHTSDWTVGNYENKQQTRWPREDIPQTHYNVTFSLNNNVNPAVPMVRSQDQLDNFSKPRLRREEVETRQNLSSSSRFSAALEQPLLDLNTTERTRTPR